MTEGEPGGGALGAVRVHFLRQTRTVQMGSRREESSSRARAPCVLGHFYGVCYTLLKCLFKKLQPSHD